MTQKKPRAKVKRGPRWTVTPGVPEERESLRVRAALAALPAYLAHGGELAPLIRWTWDAADAFVAEGEARRTGAAAP